MESMNVIHVPIKMEDMTCPICFQAFDMESCLLISLNCGHNLCSECLNKISNCPICRSNINKSSSYQKNILFSSIFERKQMQKECKIHNRVLEILSLDEQKLLCVECILQEKKVPENSIRMNQVSEQVEQMKKDLDLMKSKEDELNKNLKSTLKKSSVSLKRALDDLVEEWIAPIFQLKKKIYKEIDALQFIQEENYKKDKEIVLLNEWKNNQESLLTRWEKAAEAEAVTEIVNSHKSKVIEEKLKRIDLKKMELEKDTNDKFQSLQSRMNFIEKYTMVPWKKLEEKICSNQDELAPQIQVQLEQKYLEQYLRESGIIAEWKGEKILKIQESTWGSVFEEIKPARLKNFDCCLEKLNLECHNLSLRIFETILLLLERIKKLKEIEILIKSNVFKTLLCLEDFASKLVDIEKVKLQVTSRYILGETFRKTILGFAKLPKLQSLSLSIQGDIFGGSESEGWSEDFYLGGFKELKEMNFSFTDCKIEKVEDYKWLWRGLVDIPNLQKLTVAFLGNYINGTVLDHMYEILPMLNSIEYFGLYIEGFNNFPDINEMRSLGYSLCCLRSLKVLDLSFKGEKSLPTNSLLKSLQDLAINLPNLQELKLDLSNCLKVDDRFLINIGTSIETFQKSLTTLDFKFQKTKISMNTIESLLKSISKISSLSHLSLDFQGCSIRGFNRSTTEGLDEIIANRSLVKKELLFQDAKEDYTVVDSEVSSYDSGSEASYSNIYRRHYSSSSSSQISEEDNDDLSLYSDF